VRITDPAGAGPIHAAVKRRRKSKPKQGRFLPPLVGAVGKEEAQDAVTCPVGARRGDDKACPETVAQETCRHFTTRNGERLCPPLKAVTASCRYGSL